MRTNHRIRHPMRRALATAVGAGLLLTAATSARAGGPEVHSVVEGRDPTTDRPVLVLFGSDLTRCRGFELWTKDGQSMPALDSPLVKNKGMVVLRVPEGVSPGVYRLMLLLSSGDPLSQDVVVAQGGTAPGGVTDAALAAGLRTDLADAAAVGGLSASALRDASTRSAGTLATDRYSAIADLGVEKLIGDSAGQVAAGDHTHEALYVAPDVLAAAGSINAAWNVLQWTKLKGVPAGFADGADDLGSHTAGAGLRLAAAEISVTFAGTGTESTAARSDHDHDGAHWRRSDLDSGGTVNAASNPVDWTRLKGVPSGFADGIDGDDVLSAGTGLRLTGTQLALDFAGTGTASSAARSDHDHDLVHPRKGELDTGGTLNSAGNPVVWTRLKGVPSTIADGADADTTYSVGSGLTFSGTQFSAVFGGNGVAGTVARGDHDHSAAYSALSHEHDAWYATKSLLSSGGTVNDATNPVAWSRLRSVPSGFADGTDDSASHTAGAGLVLAGNQFALDLGGGGAAVTASRSDHDHDASYWNRGALGSAGTLNAAGNPVAWTRLDGVPAGFADGTDVNTTFAAGTGLSLSGTQFSVGLGASGTATTVARSDHDHPNTWVRRDGDALNGSLSIKTSTIPLLDVNATGNSSLGTGLRVVGGAGGSALEISCWRNGYQADFGIAISATGSSAGIHGEGSGSDSAGVLGVTSTSSGYAYVGVRGRVLNSAGVAGVYAESSADGPPALVANHGASGRLVDFSANGLAAYVESAGSATFNLTVSESTGTATALIGTTTRQGIAVEGTSSNGFGWYYGGGTGVKGTGGLIGVWGVALADPASTADDVTGVWGTGKAAGVYGIPNGAVSHSYGVIGETATAKGAAGIYGRMLYGGGSAAVYAECTASGPACLVVQHAGTSGDLYVARASGTNVARIGRDGTGYFNGGLQSSGADFAESVAVAGDPARFEPGDVIVVDDAADRQFALCTEKESHRLAGVYSTKPAMLGTTHQVAGDDSNLRGEIPLGIVGIVPTKVCDEGGPIRRGDLLVSASVPGHAMRAPADPEPGTILGKALGTLDAGRGRIEVLISFQ